MTPTVLSRRRSRRPLARLHVVAAATLVFLALVGGALVGLSSALPTSRSASAAEFHGTSLGTPHGFAAGHSAPCATSGHPASAAPGPGQLAQSERSQSPEHSSPGGSLSTTAHQAARSVHCGPRGAPPTVHDAFTQVATESWDAPATANVQRIAAHILGGDAPSRPVVTSTRRRSTAFDGKVQLFFGNLTAVRGQHFSSSL